MGLPVQLTQQIILSFFPPEEENELLKSTQSSKRKYTCSSKDFPLTFHISSMSLLGGREIQVE